MTDQQILALLPLGSVFRRKDGVVCKVTKVQDGMISYASSADESGARIEGGATWDHFGTILAEASPAAPKRPDGRFIEVAYWAWGHWSGLTWPPGQGIQRPRVAPAMPAGAIEGATAWTTIDAYRSAKDRDTCPTGMAWLVPDDQHRLKFFTGVLSTPVSVNARGGSRWRW